jgi:hypothetical protein
MTVHDMFSPQRNAARIVGAATLISMAIVVAVHYGINYKLVVSGDASKTAANVLAHPGLFRLNIAGDVLYSMGVIVVLSAYTALLEPVHRSLAWFAAVIRLVYALTFVLNAIALYFALRLFGGKVSYLLGLPVEQVQAWARAFLSIGFESYYVGLPFYALAATLCAWLLYTSRYIPRALSLVGVIGAGFGVLCAFLFILVPGFGKAVDPYWYDSPLGISEILISVWLLVRGVRPSTTPMREPIRIGAA